MSSISIEELTERFPHFRVAFVLAEPLIIQPERSRRLDQEIAAAEDECRRRRGLMELSAIPEVGAWRAAYKGFGVKRASYRSSAERLIKRVLAGEPLPRVNALAISTAIFYEKHFVAIS
jgi:DNA/RNA-binding domain of Phe-tRNA-synthetase-like protein